MSILCLNLIIVLPNAGSFPIYWRLYRPLLVRTVYRTLLKTSWNPNRWPYSLQSAMWDRHQKLDFVLVLLVATHVTKSLNLSYQSRVNPASLGSEIGSFPGALGLNHLHISVLLKAHSISFDSNKLPASVASFFKLGCSTVNCVISVGIKKNETKAHIHFCRLSPCSRLEGSASWSSLGCDLWRQKEGRKAKEDASSSETWLYWKQNSQNESRLELRWSDSHGNLLVLRRCLKE